MIGVLVLAAAAYVVPVADSEAVLEEAKAIRRACIAAVGGDAERECSLKGVTAMLGSIDLAEKLRAIATKSEVDGAREVIGHLLTRCDQKYLLPSAHDWYGLRQCYLSGIDDLVAIIDRNSPPAASK